MPSHPRRRAVAALNLVFVLAGWAGVALGTWFLQNPAWAWPAELDQGLPQKLIMAAGLWLTVHLCITFACWRGWRGATGLMAAASVFALLAWPLGTVTGALTLGLLFWPAVGAQGTAEQVPRAR